MVMIIEHITKIQISYLKIPFKPTIKGQIIQYKYEMNGEKQGLQKATYLKNNHM